MEIKVLEIRDRMTFMPVICIRPVADNEEQRYLLRRDGYEADKDEGCIILIKNKCSGVAYDPYNWDSRTLSVAHQYIQGNWHNIKDGDVIDVEFILEETKTPKRSERYDTTFESN